MLEINSLRKEIRRMDGVMKAELHKGRQPIVNYLPIDDDEKLDDAMQRINECNQEFADRLSTIEWELSEFISSCGVCPSLLSLLSLSLYSPILVPQSTHHGLSFPFTF